MPHRRLVCLVLFVLVAVLAAPPRTHADEEESWRRLRAMPREQRALLAEKLKQFEALGRAEKDAIRALDQKLAGLPANDQALYRSALRRYHLWVQGLSDAQRTELNNTPPDQRMALVSRLRCQGSDVKEGRSVSELLKVIDFGGPSPHEMAHFYKLWQKMTPAQRAEFEKLPAGLPRQERIAQLSQEWKISPETRLSNPKVDAAITRMEEQLKTKGWPLPAILSVKKEVEKESRSKHAAPNREPQLRRRAAENFVFVESPPHPVDSERLTWFEATVPAPLRPSFDHFPPEEARRRLTILYRLIYPHPSEMPAPKPVAAAPKPSPKPAIPNTTNAPASPF